MATPGINLILALQRTIRNLETGSEYQWGHMGSCNCGHLAQELTKFSKAQIHEFAMQRMGDWNEQVREYCADSGLPIDSIIDTMLDAGLSLTEIGQLEKLSNPRILELIPKARLPLLQNKRSDVVLYMKAWIKLLESSISEKVTIDRLHKILSGDSVLDTRG